MPLPSHTGTLGLKKAAHLLHRATFGPTKELIDSFAGLSAAQAVTQLFQQPIPDPVLPIDPDNGNKEWFLSGPKKDTKSDLYKFCQSWLFAQAVSQGQSVAYCAREKTVFFIHTVLTTIMSKVDDNRAIYFQNQLFRFFAFDKDIPKYNFKELTKKICIDNAMLKVLDGYLNVKGPNPQENFARELHELYTIGRGLDGSIPSTAELGDYIYYKEADVQAAAKVLSGWDLDLDFKLDPTSTPTNIKFLNGDPDTGLPRGKVKGSKTNAVAHDNDKKTFSSRFPGKEVIPNPTLLNGGNATEASAIDEISQLIENIYAQPETAKNICRRIYRFYVYHAIDKTIIDDTIINAMAATFTASGFKLQAVLEDLFQSQHFYDAAAGVNDDNFGGIIKSPLDLVAGTLRFLNIQLPDPITSAKDFYDVTDGYIQKMATMGLPFYNPYDIAGHDAYHQYPIYHRAWISTNYLAERYQFIRETLPQDDTSDILVDFVKNKFNAVASNARNLTIAIVGYLVPVNDSLVFTAGADTNSGLTAARMNYFLGAFLGIIDTDPEGMWTTRWTSNPYGTTVKEQLRNLFNAVMQSPEYQLY